MKRWIMVIAASMMFFALIGGIVEYRQFVSLPVERASAAHTPPKISSTIVSSGMPRSAAQENQ